MKRSLPILILTLATGATTACGTDRHPTTPAPAPPPTGTGTANLHGCAAWAATPPATINGTGSVWAAAEQLYLTAGPDLLHFDGTSWSRAPFDCGCETLSGVFGSSPSDVHVSAMHGGTSFHFDGTAWQEDPVSDMNAVWDSDPECVVMVGAGPQQIRHFEGEQWVADPLPEAVGSRTLFGVWGSGDKNILAVGEGGLILRHSVQVRGWGAEPTGDWAPEITESESTLRAVWGSAKNDTFVAGADGTILHFDGTSWTAMKSNTSAELRGLWGTASDDVFAVGTAGTVLHFDGQSWSTIDSGTTADLVAVSGSARGRATVRAASQLLSCAP